MKTHLTSADNSLTSEALEILNSLPVGIFLADENGIIFWVNAVLCKQFWATPEDLIGRKRQALSPHRVLTLSKSVDRFCLPSLPGKPDNWLECITGKINIPRHKMVEVGCVTDITHHKQPGKHRIPSLEIRDPGSLDPTTGLLNEKMLVKELASEISRSRRYHNPLSVTMLHVIDPLEGDGVSESTSTEIPLRRIGRLLTDRLRWVDIAGHWGHRDILLVLPETNLHAATQLAEKLYADITALPLGDERGTENPISVRIAISRWRKGDDAMQLISRLSQLLPKHPASASTDRITIG